MGFWSWLSKKEPSAVAPDRIWLTRAALHRGLCRELLEHLSNAPAVVLVAHFPATLAETRQELDRRGIPHRVAEHPVSAKEIDRLADRGADRPVLLGLTKQLQPDPFPGQHAEGQGVIQLLAAEHHFLRERDEAVIAFAHGLARRCRVTFHCSLEDPLMKAFAGEWVKGVLQHLGMDEFEAIQSAMVARRVRTAQGKFTARGGQERDSDSAGEWLQANGFGEP